MLRLLVNCSCLGEIATKIDKLLHIFQKLAIYVDGWGAARDFEYGLMKYFCLRDVDIDI